MKEADPKCHECYGSGIIHAPIETSSQGGDMWCQQAYSTGGDRECSCVKEGPEPW